MSADAPGNGRLSIFRPVFHVFHPVFGLRFAHGFTRRIIHMIVATSRARQTSLQLGDFSDEIRHLREQDSNARGAVLEIPGPIPSPHQNSPLAGSPFDHQENADYTGYRES